MSPRQQRHRPSSHDPASEDDYKKSAAPAMQGHPANTLDMQAALLQDQRLSTRQRQTIARQVGHTYGNRHLQRALNHTPPSAIQREGVLEWIGGTATNIGDRLRNATDPIAAIFQTVIDSNIVMAESIDIPAEWRTRVMRYVGDNPADGALLIPALARFPTFYRGGWIMDVQPGAAAMTLDRNIFVSGNLSLETFAHELVHVTQYATLGRTGFLTSYFGLSALEIARRFIMREPIDMMRSSPHEEQAYQLGARFDAWHSSTYGSPATGETV